MKIWNNIVVGAGISGLILGQRLRQAGNEVLIIDKAKSVGGRMATRRDDDAAFDHGAQYSSSTFADYFQSDMWLSWFNKNSISKFAFPGGMNKAAKLLAQGLEILFNHKICNLKSEDGIVVLTCEDGTQLFSNKVFLTCPVPQSVDLLKSSAIAYPAGLDEVLYHKALVGLFRLQTTHKTLEKFIYAEDEGRGIFSVSNQQSKSVSKELAFTVVMNPKFSNNYFEKSDSEVLFLVENCFSSFIHKTLGLKETDYQILRSQLKKWRYSHPQKIFTTNYCELADKRIVLLGDGFTGGSLVQAANSAYAVPI